MVSLSATAPTASEQISRERLALARPQLKTALWTALGLAARGHSESITHSRRIIARSPVGRSCHGTLAFDQATLPWK
jgi:hypothetical protein